MTAQFRRGNQRRKVDSFRRRAVAGTILPGQLWTLLRVECRNTRLEKIAPFLGRSTARSAPYAASRFYGAEPLGASGQGEMRGPFGRNAWKCSLMPSPHDHVPLRTCAERTAWKLSLPWFVLTTVRSIAANAFGPTWSAASCLRLRSTGGKFFSRLQQSLWRFGRFVTDELINALAVNVFQQLSEVRAHPQARRKRGSFRNV
jgi:hypothetical protein